MTRPAFSGPHGSAPERRGDIAARCPYLENHFVVLVVDAEGLFDLGFHFGGEVALQMGKQFVGRAGQHATAANYL